MSGPGERMIRELWRLNALPDWLRPERLKDAILRNVPEFASGTFTLEEVRPRRIHLKDETPGGTFKLLFEANEDDHREVQLVGHFAPERCADLSAAPCRVPLGQTGWHCALPELGLVLESPPPDTALPAHPVLTDARQARALLEQVIRAGSPSYTDLRIERCTPHVARHNPGSRCTVVYRLEYGPEAVGRDWPGVVVAKTHRGDKGRLAYASMCALWETGLRWSTAVAIAEPLGFHPELRVLVQRGVPGDSTLGDRLESVLLGGREHEREELRMLLARTARGLATLHGCGAHGEVYAWEQELLEVRERIGRLAAWIPGFAAALEPALARLEALAISHPADRPVASHRSFRPAQVLVSEGQIAFIDFDGFGEAEPATDLALFRASMKQNVLRSGERASWQEISSFRTQETLSELDELCELFLAEYERLTPVSRERVALWETLYLLENLLSTWEKVRSEHLGSSIALFEHHLRQHRLLLP
ncbi:MAG TPA: hypothetical protein VI504_01340 [Candidatus Eisenbacteria bacterium]|jgi:thiamine kinase-like enzyme